MSIDYVDRRYRNIPVCWFPYVNQTTYDNVHFFVNGGSTLQQVPARCCTPDFGFAPPVLRGTDIL